MVISSQDNRKVAAKSPFKINRELIRILGAEPHGVTKQRSGDLMVELRSKEQERKLKRVSSFLDIPVTVRPHKSLNTSRGVIKHSEMKVPVLSSLILFHARQAGGGYHSLHPSEGGPRNRLSKFKKNS